MAGAADWEKLQNGLISLENRDKKWSDIFSNAMFIGMISDYALPISLIVGMAGAIPITAVLG